MIQRYRAWDKTHKKLGLIDAVMVDGLFQSVKIFDEDGDDWQESENFILMQSTGLFDKNGTEIFEGDIIDTTDYEGGLSSVGNPFVKVERDKYGFVVTGDFPTSPITLKEFEAGRKFAGVKVIIAGNIYENPELLEADNDPK